VFFPSFLEAGETQVNVKCLQVRVPLVPSQRNSVGSSWMWESRKPERRGASHCSQWAGWLTPPRCTRPWCALVHCGSGSERTISIDQDTKWNNNLVMSGQRHVFLKLLMWCSFLQQLDKRSCTSATCYFLNESAIENTPLEFLRWDLSIQTWTGFRAAILCQATR